MANAYDIVMEERKKLVEKIIENMEKGDLIFKRGWDVSLLRPQNPVSEVMYLGGNRLKLGMEAVLNDYKDPRWVTFAQAKANGWNVKKGEKGTRCEKWIFTRTVKEKDENGKIVEKEEKLDKPFPTYFTVFNAEQIEGIPPLELITADKEQTYEIAEDFIASSECPIKELAQEQAFYSPSKDEIVLPLREAFKSKEAFLRTTLHEMGHSTGHESRLNRDMSGVFGSESYAKEELVAELCSIFTQARLNIKLEGEHFNDHTAYLKSWIGALKNDPSELFRAATKAEEASKRLYNNYLEREKEIIKEIDKKLENLDKPSEYWRIEFNEKDDSIKDYSNLILTKELLEEIKSLDKNLDNENKGIYKFYFEHIKDGEIIERGRIDVGTNRSEDFDYLADKLTELENNSTKKREKPLFRGLVVTFDYSEKDFGIPENTTFRGEEAYKFIKKLMEADIEQNKIQEMKKAGMDVKGSYYEKTYVYITYRDYETGRIRIDLGDLEFGGKEKVSDGLEYRLKSFPQNLIDEKEFWAKGREKTPEKIAETGRDMLNHIDEVMVIFREHEKKLEEREQAKITEKTTTIKKAKAEKEKPKRQTRKRVKSKENER